MFKTALKSNGNSEKPLWSWWMLQFSIKLSFEFIAIWIYRLLPYLDRSLLPNLESFFPPYLSCSNMNLPIIIRSLPKTAEILFCLFIIYLRHLEECLACFRCSINKCFNGWMNEFPSIAWEYWMPRRGWQMSESGGSIDE